MPHQTFLNLPVHKREKIIAVALKEFALKDYHYASISSLVKDLNVAKGSIYQYFKDKRDFYFFLIKYTNSRKLMVHHKSLKKVEKNNLDDFLLHYFITSLKFDINFPRTAVLQKRFRAQHYETKIIKDVYEENEVFYSNVMDDFMNEVGKTNLEKRLIAFLLDSLPFQMFDFTMDYFDIELERYLISGEPIDVVSNEDIIEVTHSFHTLSHKFINK